jgi:hypothetical protein
MEMKKKERKLRKCSDAQETLPLFSKGGKDGRKESFTRVHDEEF